MMSAPFISTPYLRVVHDSPDPGALREVTYEGEATAAAACAWDAEAARRRRPLSR
jgi:hypothetical protein